MRKRKIFVFIFVIVLSFSAAACGTPPPSPSEVVSEYLEALKAHDEDTIAKLYAGDRDDTAIELDEDEDDEAPFISHVLQDKLQDMLFSFEYAVSNEEIDGDTATVDVKIKTYDFGSIFQSSFMEAFPTLFAMAFIDSPDDLIEYKLNDILLQKLNAAEADYERTVALTLTKGQDGWIIDEYEEDGAFRNALTGGIVNFLKDFEQLCGE